MTSSDNPICGECANQKPCQDDPSWLQDLKKDTDLLLIGDGSGTSLSKVASWFVYGFDSIAGTQQWWAGAVSSGTNNYAELYPYIHALWDYGSRLDHGDKTIKQIRIVSDSQITVRCGTGEYARSSNLPYWAAIEQLENSGMEIDWRHIPRSSIVFNQLADLYARELRKEMTRVCKAIDNCEEGLGTTHCNQDVAGSLDTRSIHHRLAELLER